MFDISKYINREINKKNDEQFQRDMHAHAQNQEIFIKSFKDIHGAKKVFWMDDAESIGFYFEKKCH